MTEVESWWFRMHAANTDLQSGTQSGWAEWHPPAQFCSAGAPSGNTTAGPRSTVSRAALATRWSWRKASTVTGWPLASTCPNSDAAAGSSRPSARRRLHRRTGARARLAQRRPRAATAICLLLEKLGAPRPGLAEPCDAAIAASQSSPLAAIEDVSVRWMCRPIPRASSPTSALGWRTGSVARSFRRSRCADGRRGGERRAGRRVARVGPWALPGRTCAPGASTWPPPLLTWR